MYREEQNVVFKVVVVSVSQAVTGNCFERPREEMHGTWQVRSETLSSPSPVRISHAQLCVVEIELGDVSSRVVPQIIYVSPHYSHFHSHVIAFPTTSYQVVRCC